MLKSRLVIDAILTHVTVSLVKLLSMLTR